MKKVICAVVLFAALVSSLVACGGNSSQDKVLGKWWSADGTFIEFLKDGEAIVTYQGGPALAMKYEWLDEKRLKIDNYTSPNSAPLVWTYGDAGLPGFKKVKEVTPSVKESIIGTWQKSPFRFTFNEDGTCTTQAGQGTYEWLDEETLFLTTNKSIRQIEKFKVSGDTVTFMELDGSTINSLQRVRSLPSNMQIACLVENGQSFGLLLIKGGNSSPVQLTKGMDVNVILWSWSPTGSRIAFIGHPISATNDSMLRQSLYVVNPDGTGLTKIAGPLIGSFRWSPDGKQIAYESYETTYVINVDDSSKQIVLPNTILADWSPDGTQLVDLDRSCFVGGKPCTIRATNVDGSGQKILGTIPLTGGIHESSFSPDGKRIAFVYRNDNTGGTQAKADILVYDIEKNLLTTLARDFNGVSTLSWSPDNQKIAFTGVVTHTDSVYIKNLDGTDVANFQGSDPEWSPDGKLIATYGVVRNIDGTGAIDLSADYGCMSLRWKP